ncbi:MAG TPA: TIR domain-containing protein [Thermoanaerobaculia bacterium]|nr:TIR domain-containing protein [Thermoanaerobaculia bacterium]
MPTVPVRFVHPLLRARDYQEREELARLAEWWRRGGVGVCALVGIGGAGKTAVADRFLRLLPGVLPVDPALPKDPSLSQPVGLFVFSFYDAPNPDSFFAELAAWLRGEAPGGGWAVSYGETLRLLEGAGPVLLVLDGLEKVQDDGARGGIFGQIQDGRLRDLVLRVAEGYLQGPALLVTTRFRLVEPLVRRAIHYHPIPVDKITREAAIALLRARGVRKGNGDDLARLAEEHGRHALTVDLLGGFIGTFCGGDLGKLPAQRDEIVAEAPDLDAEVLALREQERKLARVSSVYREALKEKDPAALALLERVCLFRLGVNTDVLSVIFTGKGKEKVSGPELASLGVPELQAKLAWLVELRLLEAARSSDGETLFTVHPAVRDGVLRGVGSDAARLGHQVAREGLQARLGERPGEDYPSDPAVLDLLEEILYHTLKAELPQEAWKLYCVRIGAYENLGWRLGAYERGQRICSAFAEGQSPEATPLPTALSEASQAAFVNEWGLYLANLGQLDVAERCHRRAKDIDGGSLDWVNVSLYNQNLAVVSLRAGRLQTGKRAAEEALVMAERAEDAMERAASHAYRGHARALLGESGAAIVDFQKALLWQDGSAGKIDQSLYSDRGVFQALLLVRLGRLKEAERVTKENKVICIRDYGDENPDNINLLLADQARLRGDFTAARDLLLQARDWALARDAKEPLCWAALVQARIALSAGQPGEALYHLKEGLRLACDHGYGIYNIDLLNTLAEVQLRAGRPIDAEQAARTALYGAGDRDGSATPDQRGVFPPLETGLPVLLAATHPECLYAWGEADARHLLAEALLLRASATPDPGDLVREAQTELVGARDLRRKILDPRAEESAARLDEIKKGVLTHYPLPVATSVEKPAAVPAPAARDQVFISYSHLDKDWLQRLRRMLRPLERNGAISLWDDTAIQPGGKWKEEIQKALASAKVAVLLVSDHFLDSDFIAQEELPPLLAAAEKEGVKILWVYLSSCRYDVTPIGDYQAAHDIAQALDELPEPAQKRVLSEVSGAR